MGSSNAFHDIVDTFQFISDWETRYHFLVELGERLPELDAVHRVEDNRVHGCMSKVWIAAEPSEADPRVLNYLGDCDTPTIKGLVAVLIALYSGNPPDDVVRIDADQVFEKLGLHDHLSPNRHVGVYAIVEKIKEVSRRFDETADGGGARRSGTGPMRTSAASSSSPSLPAT